MMLAVARHHALLRAAVDIHRGRQSASIRSFMCLAARVSGAARPGGDAQQPSPTPHLVHWPRTPNSNTCARSSGIRRIGIALITRYIGQRCERPLFEQSLPQIALQKSCARRRPIRRTILEPQARPFSTRPPRYAARTSSFDHSSVGLPWAARRPVSST